MTETDATEPQGTKDSTDEKKAQRRKIPGNLPYTSSPGVLQRALDKIIISEKPPVFSPDFLSTVIGANGGASRPIIPILKSTGLLNQSAVPTEVYSQFQTEGGRANAALHALKTGFSELFKRNQFIHRADEKSTVDTIVATTGLPKTDPIVNYIYKTFKVFQTFTAGANDQTDTQQATQSNSEKSEDTNRSSTISIHDKIGLVYNINIVLPETTNIDVYNAIFRSIKGNMM